MDINKMQERKEIFDDAIHCRKPKRIPTLSNAWAWKILDTDLNPKPSFVEATSNWGIMEHIIREHIERYQFDSYTDLGFRFNSSYQQVLGDKIRHTADDDHGVYALDTTAMTENDYDEFTQDPAMFNWTKMMPRVIGDVTYSEMEKLVDCYLKFGAFVGKMYSALVSDYSCPILSPNIIQPPVEELFNFYRGIKGFSNDMRRHPDKILTCNEMLSEKIFAKAEALMQAPSDALVCHFTLGFLAPTVMNPKQFEKFYWPMAESLVNLAAKNDKKVFLFIEGETSRFAPYLNSLPKGSIIVQVETDDIFEVRKLLPDICITGGMPVDLLGVASKEACIDYAKRLCDELGGSGYIFSQNKMMSYQYDGTRENMLAVQDFVLNYKL